MNKIININNLNPQNLAQQAIISNKIQDYKQIELTFDYMLDFCYDDEMLLLYKKLAQYYFTVNPQGTASYINYYRERYEDE